MSQIQRISEDEMIESIMRSGYLLEQRVSPIFEKKGFMVNVNDSYQDLETKKSREIDLRAFEIFDLAAEGNEGILVNVFAECENNPQPLVFFQNESNQKIYNSFEDLKITGSPLYIEPKSKHKDIAEYLSFQQFHHYCLNNIYTQYCSFHQTKQKEKKWVASHNDQHHNTFVNLIKCLKHNMNHDIEFYHVGSSNFNVIERISLSIYLPVLILGGEIYEAKEVDSILSIKKINHAQFRKSMNFDRQDQLPEVYQIDVITESYLERYLDLVRSEVKEVLNRIKADYSSIKRSAVEISQILNDDSSTENIMNYLIKDTPRY